MDDLIVPAPPGPVPVPPPSGDADQNLVAQKLNIIENAIFNVGALNHMLLHSFVRCVTKWLCINNAFFK